MSQQQISLAAYEPFAAASGGSLSIWWLAGMLCCPMGVASKLAATSMQDCVLPAKEKVNGGL